MTKWRLSEALASIGLPFNASFPSLVHFVGPDDLIRPLKSPKIAGKVLTIEGLLYTGSRMLFIIGVDEGEEAGTN